MADLDSLKYLIPLVPQVPTPLEVLVFLSSHPILNQIDPSSGKNTSFQHLDYQLIDPKTALVHFSCQFPNSRAQAQFEKDLKLKKFTFTTLPPSQFINYEFTIKKGQRLQ